ADCPNQTHAAAIRRFIACNELGSAVRTGQFETDAYLVGRAVGGEADIFGADQRCLTDQLQSVVLLDRQHGGWLGVSGGHLLPIAIVRADGGATPTRSQWPAR